MYGAERAPPNLLLDDVLIDAVLSRAIVLAGNILGSRIERLLQRSANGIARGWVGSSHFHLAGSRVAALMMSQRTFVCGRRSRYGPSDC
jgi:hypothetical protein